MQKIRNVAIIAHVDHGKTTLIDKMLIAGNLFRNDKTELNQFLDSDNLERERGITIFAKNVSINYKNHKINIIDTPGHADFGGEVERVLNMADGVLLVVDAFEGPMPQTRFVLQKAINLGLKPVVVINKIDKPNCLPEEVQERVFDLMFSLNATEEQLDFITIYGSAKHGWMSNNLKKKSNNIYPVLDAIIEHIPAPKVLEGILQMQITSLDYSNYVGRIAIGRIHRGELKEGMEIALCKRNSTILKFKIKEINVFEGLGRIKVQSVKSGDICAIIGIENFEIGDTITDSVNPKLLAPIVIDEPTISMLFTINDSPFFGKEGMHITSSQIHERLIQEMDKNLALRVLPSDLADSWIVHGRGILHLSILIETMRREGYELQVGQPQVIIKEEKGIKMEPVEQLAINLPEEYSSRTINIVTKRKGEIVSMEHKNNRIYIEFIIPSRGIIGLTNSISTASAGEAIMTHRFIEYQAWKGEIEKRKKGSIIAIETGNVYAYALDKLQNRGKFFIYPQTNVYAGQIVGEHCKEGDLVVNVTKSKKLTNIRASGNDSKVHLAPPIIFSIEQALEYIKEDEYVELTPYTIRLRKIILNANKRKTTKK